MELARREVVRPEGWQAQAHMRSATHPRRVVAAIDRAGGQVEEVGKHRFWRSALQQRSGMSRARRPAGHARAQLHSKRSAPNFFGCENIGIGAPCAFAVRGEGISSGRAALRPRPGAKIIYVYMLPRASRTREAPTSADTRISNESHTRCDDVASGGANDAALSVTVRSCPMASHTKKAPKRTMKKKSTANTRTISARLPLYLLIARSSWSRPG